MTSRLKRKLDNMGVDVSNVTENFCMIGTPLPSLEKADKNEFVPVWKQDVRDEKGRRRLHGAFTGGFSAGYFNTVGSKEGWTPATFVSSRANRAGKDQRVQRPEDFMDEEDLSELRADQKLVDTTHADGAPGDPAAPDDANIWNALVPSVRDSPGAKLLQKMGWRPGQGVGPRITYAKRRAQDRIAGAAASQEGDEMDDEEAGKHLYAPRDTVAVVYRAKEDSFGLGYVRGAGLREGDGGRGKKAEEGQAISAGFGLGALNDADEDDLDVYDGSRAPTDKRRLAYTIDEDEDEPVLLGSKQAAPFRRPAPTQPQTVQAQFFFPDGRPVLQGFKPAGAPLTEDVWFAPPEVPEDWKPDPSRVWELNGSVKEGGVGVQGKAVDGKPAPLRAEERGAMLGETPLAPRSVFDYLSKEARDRLQKASASLKPPSAVEIKKEPSPPPEVKMEIPVLEPATAAAALRGYQPFTADPVKQQRYTTYLQMQASRSELPAELAPLPRQEMDSFNKELEDYAKAARIFKPASGAMASRFTSSSTVEMDAKPREGLHAPEEQGGYLEQKAAEESRMEVQETPRQHAAKMGMFGPLTRDVSTWVPSKLLCKRFGVKDPYPDGVPGEEKPAVTPAWKAPESSTASQPLTNAVAASMLNQDKENVPTTKKDISNVGLGDDDDQGRDILTYEKPGMDIFKAIFASDDEDSDEEEEPPAPVPAPKVESTPLKSVENQSAAPHLTAESSSAAIYNPSGSDARQGLDISSFRPTFVPKTERRKDKEADNRPKKDKKDKKKKDKHLLVSFDAEEGITVTPSRDESSKKRKREDKERAKDRDRDREKEEKRKRRRAGEEEEDDGMWVEKPPPDVLVQAAVEKEPPSEANAHPGRKRAVDFF
ncbi:DUF1604-domain-containing protein [Calocera cornea HHB12733]|uniref:DUF1604-domain-containing protein n=1 Tax=Calocera cornea HHB12733 TaxID=1353952 RepID=A0A165HM83_9BASI|nr:DUF1604-domain-containing protein [Calocera cornea HHB12733]